MGQRIHTYSLSELNKISTPGKVIPSLFWLIPIGEWDYNELSKFWTHFTKNRSICKEMGLMLVKTNDIKKEPTQTSNLSGLTGKISEILPSGTKTIYRDELQLNKKLKNQVLILSGSYPQPGWGVHISLDSVLHFESILEKSIDYNLREIFIKGSNSYKFWINNKKKQPEKVNLADLTKKKDYCVHICKILGGILSEDNDNHINEFYFQLLKQEFDSLRSKSSEEYYHLIEPLFEMIDNGFIVSLLILKALNKLDEDEINSSLARFVNEHNFKTNNLFKTEKNEQIKKTAGNLLKLGEQERPREKFVFWAKNTVENKKNEIVKIIKTLNENLGAIIGDIVVKIEKSDDIYIEKLEEWEKKVDSSRKSFRRHLQDVLQSHLKYGPDFLMNIEDQTKNLGSKSFSWDPARMIGWKIISAGIQIEALDIIQRVKEIIPEFSTHSNSNYDENTLMNGSLFTDFVHYISLKDPSISPRDATKKLLEKTLRSSEIKRILRKKEDVDFNRKNISQMVETLLLEFGWPAEDKSEKHKLADCLIENDRINPSFTGNDIRTICESYCKDFIDTLSTILGYSAEKLLDTVKVKDPKYRSQNRGWSYDISELSLGSAIIILSALLSEAYPNDEEVSKQFIKTLNGLRQKFNRLSHDPPSGNLSDLTEGILSLQEYTKEIISEMPWHLSPVQRNGSQPTILTGEAWSHSYKGSRQLSIILWNNDQSESLLIWNPTKVNPVVPDGHVINRPQ